MNIPMALAILDRRPPIQLLLSIQNLLGLVTALTFRNFTDSPVKTYDTPIGEVRFRPEPVGRGTVGILLSCTATYVFSVWTSLHPNLISDATKGARLWYKTVLMCLSIQCPEGMMICAFGEWLQAKVWEAWKENMAIHEDGDQRKKKIIEAFQMNTAFFVVMGSF